MLLLVVFVVVPIKIIGRIKTSRQERNKASTYLRLIFRVFSLLESKMTVSYQYDVASSTSGGFTRLLFKWRGSLYKLVYYELALFLIAYGAMSCIYRFAFSEPHKRYFEQVVFYCDTYMNYIPLSFILGFYVSFVASRWWQQYLAIPWPDKMLHAIALHVSGPDDKGRMIRRTLVRYLNLSLVLVLRSISSAVKKRFPTLEHLIEAGLITQVELDLFNMVPNKEFNTYWIPCTWFTNLLKDAKSQGRVMDPVGVKLIMEEFCEFRQKCGMLWSFDWVSIPLVYTQVVTIATYCFFMAAIVGRQYVEKSAVAYKNAVDLYIPFFTILQFFFYMGLLKVAEQLINPFGDDDEDFELNWIIDRHLKVSYLIVDTLLVRCPPLTKDIFYDDESPDLPYTEAAAIFKKRTYRGSVANMKVPEEKQSLILPDIIEEGEEPVMEDGSLGVKGSHSSSQYLNGSGSERNVSSPTPKLVSAKGAAAAGATAVAVIAATRDSTAEGDSSDDYGHVRRDSRTLLEVPESGGQHSPRGRRFLRLPLSRASSRKAYTAGSKGIGNALLAAGSGQGLMAEDLSRLSEKLQSVAYKEEQVFQRSPVLTGDLVPEQEIRDLFQDVCLDVEDPLETIDPPSSWLPPSIKAKLSVKKKPVITWRPYIKREEEAVEEVEVEDGVFEDECAFMWRTIEDDIISLKTSCLALQEEAMKVSSAKGMAHYAEVKPSNVKNNIEPPFSMVPLPRHSRGRRGRARYKVRGRTRPHSSFSASLQSLYKSLPLLPLVSPSTSPSPMETYPLLVRSLSEMSVFLKIVNKNLAYYRRLQQASLRYQQLKSKTIPSQESPSENEISYIARP